MPPANQKITCTVRHQFHTPGRLQINKTIHFQDQLPYSVTSQYNYKQYISGLYKSVKNKQMKPTITAKATRPTTQFDHSQSTPFPQDDTYAHRVTVSTTSTYIFTSCMVITLTDQFMNFLVHQMQTSYIHHIYTQHQWNAKKNLRSIKTKTQMKLNTQPSLWTVNNAQTSTH